MYRINPDRILFLLILLISTDVLAQRVPWQRRIGRDVEIRNRLQYERVLPDMWPPEPDSPSEVNLELFTDALQFLCGGAIRLPDARARSYAETIIENAARFETDPFLIAALIFNASRCLPKQPNNETRRYGLSRLDIHMHAPHIRRGRYNWFAHNGDTWEPRYLEAPDHPFNLWRAANPLTNIYWTAAILRVFELQQESLRQAFPEVSYRHSVSHWFFGDNVRHIEPEDRILTARRRMLEYYHRTEPAIIGDWNGVPLVSPLDGTPRLVLDRFGIWRGPRRTGYRHNGLDLVSEHDEPIRTVADGRIVFVGVDLPGSGSLALTPAEVEHYGNRPMGRGGFYVVIRHRENLRSYYMHMASVTVTDRQEVRAGEIIGTVGRSGNQTSGAHLHLEFRLGSERLDPAPYLKAALIQPE